MPDDGEVTGSITAVTRLADIGRASGRSASPSVGTHSRAMTSDLEGLETQAADIAFLISYAHALPQADTSRIGVIGYSWGGLSNVLAAARDDRINALVSLDGSVRSYSKYIDGGINSAKYVTPTRLAVPLLYLAKHPRSIEEMSKMEIDTRFSLMNTMKYSDVYIMTMMPMSH